MNSEETLATGERPQANIVLTDVLAIDRTQLANERTLLAWVRTSLMMLASGVTLIKLFEGVLYVELLGFALLPVSAVTVIYGVHRFIHMRGQIADSRQRR